MTLTLLVWGWWISKDYLFQRCPSVRTSRRWRTPWPLRTDTPRPTWWSAPRPSTRNTIILTFLEDNYTIYNLDRHKIISCGLDRYSIRLKTYSLNMVTACDRSGIPKFIPNACTLLCLTFLLFPNIFQRLDDDCVNSLYCYFPSVGWMRMANTALPSFSQPTIRSLQGTKRKKFSIVDSL